MSNPVTLAQICEQHGLLSATISCIRRTSDLGLFYSCNVQWPDPTKEDGRNISGGIGDTEGEALRKALAGMPSDLTLELERAA